MIFLGLQTPLEGRRRSEPGARQCLKKRGIRFCTVAFPRFQNDFCTFLNYYPLLDDDFGDLKRRSWEK